MLPFCLIQFFLLTFVYFCAAAFTLFHQVLVLLQLFGCFSTFSFHTLGQVGFFLQFPAPEVWSKSRLLTFLVGSSYSSSNVSVYDFFISLSSIWVFVSSFSCRASFLLLSYVESIFSVWGLRSSHPGSSDILSAFSTCSRWVSLCSRPRSFSFLLLYLFVDKTSSVNSSSAKSSCQSQLERIKNSNILYDLHSVIMFCSGSAVLFHHISDISVSKHIFILFAW